MRRLRDAHTAHNLKPRQFQILGLLHDHGGLAQGELVQKMGVEPSILVTLLNPLEADGLVSRERDPGDRRRHLVTLTPAGEQHLADAARAQREAEDALFASLDATSASSCEPCCSRCATGSPPTPRACTRRGRPRVKLTVFGATGGVGREVVAQALDGRRPRHRLRPQPRQARPRPTPT